MRFRELHLKAFGAFTGRTLDLSKGKEGLHLIHGPNEAGKSTTLRAITQLLYGIDARTADGFVHPLQNLRIGATLGNGKETLSLVRRKGNKNTLLTLDEKDTLDDDALAAYLGGVDAAVFTNFFGLSHEQLVRGGQGLVQGEGDVGQALFSAAAGMGNLRALLNRLEGDAGELFSPRASKPAINHAISRLSELRKELKALQLSSSEWQALDDERQASAARRVAVDAELREAKTAAARLKRIQDALPLVAERATLLAQLAPLSNQVVLREDFSERRQHCHTEARAAETMRDSAAKALDAYNKDLAEILVDEALLAHESTLEELNERRAQNQKALGDRERELAPALERLETENERALHQLRPHWTLAQVEELRLAPGQERRIHELSRQGEGLQVHCDNAAAAHRKRIRERDQARQALEELGAPRDPGEVERALKPALQASAAAAECVAIEARIGSLRNTIQSSIARLGIWSGTMEALETLAVPGAASIERFRLDLDEADRNKSHFAETETALNVQLREAQGTLRAFQTAHDAPSLAALEEARRVRQEGWRLARAAWESGVLPSSISDEDAVVWMASLKERHPDVENLADAFGASVEIADFVADRLRNEAERVATLAQLEAGVSTLGDELRQVQEARSAQSVALEALDQSWVDLWTPTGITPATPREMAEFRQAHADILKQIADLREAEAALHAQSGKATERLEQLRDALRGAVDMEDAATLDEAVAMAESWVAAQRDLVHQRQQYEAVLRKLDTDAIPEAEDALASATTALDAWRDAWSALAEDLGAPATASPGEVLALVEAINGLLAKADDAADLQRRIARIDCDDSDFRDAVRGLAGAVGADTAAKDEASLVQSLYAKLNASRAARQDRERLVKLRDAEAGRLRDAEVQLARVDATWNTLCEEAGVADPDALPDAEKASAARQRLEAAQHSVERQLIALSAGVGLEALLAMVAGEEADSLDSNLATLATRIEDLDDERLDLRERLGRLDEQLRQMDGSDAAAQKEEEAQALIASIVEDSETYARTRIAAHVLRTAIERYRAANQEPLLARAGERFRQLTLGSFAELRAEVNEKDEHVLCGIRAETGARVSVDGMSEGTADQLYLALRLASLERHLENHPPIPFILDDILVNFDDERASAALQALAEVSERTQVIYFTHHEHLVELAKGCVGKKQLFVQSLAGSGDLGD